MIDREYVEIYRFDFKFDLKKFIAILLLLGIVTYLVFRDTNKEELPIYITPVAKVDTVRIDTFSENNLIIELFELKIQEPNIVMNQSKLETGNFKSNLFLKSNNLFGFRNHNGYIKYNHWKESVKAYKIWQNKKYKGGDYYAFLNKINYAEDTMYINKLKEF